MAADDYQEKYEQLLEEKKKVELEFGLARRRFKELYVGCENQLNNEKENTRQLDIQVKELVRQVDALKSENEGIRIVAKISEEAKQEEFQNLKSKHDEEIASMQHIWKEASYDNQNRLAKEYEDERKKLLEANSKLEQKIKHMEQTNVVNQNKSSASGGAGDSMLSLMSNAFISRTSRPSSQQSVKGGDATATATAGGSLENTQMQVKQDIDAWKSVVEPLEAEIESLKKQLAEANTNSSKQQQHAASISPKKTSEKEHMLNEELKEAHKYFESEKSARTDLEMYVAVLNTQKTVLQEDSDKLKRELHNVCRLFEQEKMNHNELKQTWKMANEQFLGQQNKAKAELELTRSILTPAQIEQLSRNKFSDTANAIKTVAEHPYQVSTDDNDSSAHQSLPLSTKSSNNLIDFDGGEAKQSQQQSESSSLVDKQQLQQQQQQQQLQQQTVNEATQKSSNLKSEIFSTFFPAAFQAQQFNEMLSTDNGVKEQPLILSSSSDSEDDDLEHALRIQNMNRYANESTTTDAAHSQVNPLAILDDFNDGTTSSDQSSSIAEGNQSITEPSSQTLEKSFQGDASLNSRDVSLISNIDSTNRDNKSNTPSSSSAGISGGGDDSIWNNVSVEYAHTCMMCQNYERQLQLLQKDFVSAKDSERQQTERVKDVETKLSAEREHMVSLEHNMETTSSDNRAQICIYEKNQLEVDRQVLLLQEQFQEFQMNILKEMKTLMGDES